MSYAIRGVALNNTIRVLAINSTSLVKEVQQQLKLSPCASAALGRTMAITSLLGLMQKNDDQVFITIDGKGPLGKIHTQYLGNGQLRGYVDNPQVATIINEQHKLGVKEVVGNDGYLNVNIRQSLKSDYHGSVPLVSGEISEDFTYYFAHSEQTPSVVSAGVLVAKDEAIISSGALIIQLLPQAAEEEIKFIESKLAEISDLSKKLEDNSKIEDFVRTIFNDFVILAKQPIDYTCLCNYEDMQAKISTLPLVDLEEIKKEDHGLEAVCPWCNTKYYFDENDLEIIIELKKG